MYSRHDAGYPRLRRTLERRAGVWHPDAPLLMPFMARCGRYADADIEEYRIAPGNGIFFTDATARSRGGCQDCLTRLFGPILYLRDIHRTGVDTSPILTLPFDAKRISALLKTTYMDHHKMGFELFEKYESAIRDYRGPQGDPQSPSLRMHRNGDLVVYYAPVGWVNPTAKLVLVDATPWKAQADIALTEAHRALLEGAPVTEVLRRASLAAAFAGAARQRVILLLDHIGVHQWLGLNSSADLFGAAGDLLQVSSVLPFPVFKNGANFRGGWHPERDPMLRLQMRDHFGKMAKAMPEAVFIPVGAAASRGVEWLTKEGFLTKERVLHGLPHPRKEEPNRTAYFLGEKDRVDLDKDTHPDKIDAARDYLRSAVAALK